MEQSHDSIKSRLHLELVSNISGRQRWQTRHLINRPVLAARLAMVLGSDEALVCKEINASSGRILFTHVSISQVALEDRIRSALYKLMSEVVESDTERPGLDLQPVVKEQVEQAAKGALLELVKIFPPEKREFAKASGYSLVNTVVNFTPELVLIGIVNVVNGKNFGLLTKIGLTTMRKQVFTPSVFTLILFFVPKLLVRMESMGAGYDQYKLANQAAHEILQELAVEAKVVSGSRHIEPAMVQGEIVFKDVSFGYRPDHLVLENFNLKIPAHSTIAFIGATGSGKSTVVKLIARMYETCAGTILLDGEDVREVVTEDLRISIDVVSQEAFLFDASVYDNIMFGCTDATYKEVLVAAKPAEAHTFISALPEGYETMIGERGKLLSGGQRQRISIARAILKNAPILVFDEATSAVNHETEAAIQRSIDRFTKNRTAILIAHRLSTVRNVSCIHIMADGKIIESGAHEQLLALNCSYAALWRVQTGEIKHDHAA